MAAAIYAANEAVVQLTFDAKNLSAAQSARTSASFSAAEAAEPDPVKRAQLRLLAPNYMDNTGNPRLDPRMFPTVGGMTPPGLSDADTATLASFARQLNVSPSTMLGIGTNEGAGDPTLANPMSVSDAARRAALPYLLRAGIDPSKLDARGQSFAYGTGYVASMQLGTDPAVRDGGYQTGPYSPAVARMRDSGGSDTSGFGAIGGNDVRNMMQLRGGAPDLSYSTPGSTYFDAAPTASQMIAAGASDPNLTARNDATLDAAHQAALASNRDAQDALSARTAAARRAEALRLAGQPGQADIADATYNASPGQDPTTASLQTSQRVTQVQMDQQKSFDATSISIRQQTSDSLKLAEAWKTSSAAADQAQRGIDATKAALADISNPTAYATRLAEENAEAVAKQAESYERLHTQTQQQIDSNTFAAGLPLMSDTDRARAISQNKATTDAQTLFPNDQAQQNSYVQQQGQLFDSQAAVEGTQKVNQAMQSLGSTITDTFASAMQGGQSFKHLLGELFTSIGEIVEKMILMQPLQNMFGSGSGSLFGNSLNGLGQGNGIFGMIGGALGLTSHAAPALAGSSAALDPTLGTGFFARGGVVQAPRFHATGMIDTIVNTPTAFKTADGADNVAGEAGPEAIMPLKMMPNGNVGIDTGAGRGGGGGMMVHAPITVMNQPQQNGQMDPQAAAMMQKHIEKVVSDGVNAVMLRQQRPGGSLWNATRAAS